MIKLDFNAPPTGRDFGKPMEPLADGEYDGVIDDATVATSQATNTQYIKMKLKTKPGNRVVFENLSLLSQNPKAVSIAHGKLADICKYGIESGKDSFHTLDEIAAHIKGAPIRFYYKNSGKDAKGYDRHSVTFKPLAASASKKSVATPTAAQTAKTLY
jgi:hypothetical protein